MNIFIRKVISFVGVILLCLAFSGCSMESVGEISFNAQYIKTDAMVEGGEYPVLEKINSKDELLDYYQDKLDSYNFVNNTDVSVSFATAIDKYNDEYFENSFLMIIVLEEKNSSIYPNIRKVSKRGEIVIERNVDVDTVVSEAYWHVLVEMDNEYKNLDFKVLLEDLSE